MTLLAPTREPEPAQGVPSDEDLQRILSLDFETCCEEDLRRVGSDLYTKSPSLVVTVIGWAFDDGLIESVTWPSTHALPKPVHDHLRLGGKFRAWNAHFEFGVLANHYRLDLEDAQALCTMQQALHAGLPAALGDAGPALGLAILKDVQAHRLMLQMSKLRSWWPNKIYWHETDPAKLAALEVYCRQDVAAEREIARNVPDLPPKERRISLLDRATNNRGVTIDTKLVKAMKRLAETEIMALNDECRTITDGAVTSPGTQVAKLVTWFKKNGLPATGLGKSEVDMWLRQQPLTLAANDDRVTRVLEIRQRIAKSSLKKLSAMERCMDADARVRGQLAYYGAFRTGRFAGRQIQPQNFPRPGVKRVLECVEDILRGCDVDWLRAIYGEPLDTISSCLRACLVPSPGKSFVIFDLSQIEARVVAWLAGQLDVLEVFARGEDVYVYAQNSLGLNSRLAGKVVTLALGFQMGALKFQATAAAAGLLLTLDQAQAIVDRWRAKNSRIVALWWSADRAAKEALKVFAQTRKPVSLAINDKLSISVSASRAGLALMTMKLPSGRRLYYRNACLAQGPKGEEIVYDGVDPRTKRWTQVRTYGGKLIENATQGTARDVIVEGALRVDDLGLGELVLSAHDELVEEADTALAQGRAALIKAEIERRPAWALDLPVASEGGVRSRYGK